MKIMDKIKTNEEGVIKYTLIKNKEKIVSR